YSGAKPDSACALGCGSYDNFRTGGYFPAAGVVFAKPNLIVTQLVHPFDQFKIALKAKGGVFMSGVKRSHKSAKFQSFLCHRKPAVILCGCQFIVVALIQVVACLSSD